MLRQILIVLFVAFFWLDAQGRASKGEDSKSSVMVYGNGAVFTVSEPNGWHCICDGPEPARLAANAVFIKNGGNIDSTGTIIRIRLNVKADENIEEDMRVDLDGYLARYPKLESKNIDLTHDTYKLVSKEFLLKGVFAEYIAYINPGPKFKHAFASSMNVTKREATPEELAAYRSVSASLQLLGDQVKISSPGNKTKR